jgi:uroporphyrinogen-III synthase
MAVVVTRPLPEALRWAERLRERGHDPLVLPLLEIGPPPDDSGLRQAVAQIERFAAVMFVSANAVHGFFAVAGRVDLPRAWAPGPGTAEALRSAGVPASKIEVPADQASRFDSESLWARVHEQVRPGDSVLIVRGADAQGRSQGREWLAQQLSAAGVQVAIVVAYARRAPAWNAQQVAAAQRAAQDGSLWLFSSSEAAHQLAHLLPHQDWSRAQALATHPRIAQAVRQLGFGAVHAARPAFDDVLASIESHR